MRSSRQLPIPPARPGPRGDKGRCGLRSSLCPLASATRPGARDLVPAGTEGWRLRMDELAELAMVRVALVREGTL